MTAPPCTPLISRPCSSAATLISRTFLAVEEGRIQ